MTLTIHPRYTNQYRVNTDPHEAMEKYQLHEGFNVVVCGSEEGGCEKRFVVRIAFSVTITSIRMIEGEQG